MHGFLGGHYFGWIFWIIIIGFIIYVVLKTTGKKGSLLITETPIDILKKRYAKGEISKEDFEKMKNDL